MSDPITAPHQPVDHAGRRMARLSSRHPLLLAIGMALVPVVCTAVGFGAAQATGADDRVTYLAAAAGATVSAVLGLLAMVLTRPTLSEHGFRAPRSSRVVLWYLPLLLVPVLVGLTSGVAVPVALVPGFVWLAAAAAVNEEVWYRGLLLATLRGRGSRFAVVVAGALFALLHLANAANGASPLYLSLQVIFALLFAVVAAEVFLVVGSLWPVIAWHFLHDVVSYLGGDAIGAPQLAALGAGCAVLAAYAVLLWRRLPA